MISFAYKIKAFEINSRIICSNIASIKAFEKVGFKREATMKNYFKYRTSDRIKFFD